MSPCHFLRVIVTDAAGHPRPTLLGTPGRRSSAPQADAPRHPRPTLLGTPGRRSSAPQADAPPRRLRMPGLRTGAGDSADRVGTRGPDLQPMRAGAASPWPRCPVERPDAGVEGLRGTAAAAAAAAGSCAVALSWPLRNRAGPCRTCAEKAGWCAATRRSRGPEMDTDLHPGKSESV